MYMRVDEVDYSGMTMTSTEDLQQWSRLWRMDRKLNLHCSEWKLTCISQSSMLSPQRI